MSLGRYQRYEIPAEPLRKHLQAWIDRHGYETEAGNEVDGVMSPHRLICEKLWPGGEWKNKTRQLWALLNERENISFDTADKIICGVLERPWLWQSDPELSAAYQSADLRSLDATRPTCEKVRRATERKVVAAFRRTGTLNETVGKTGISIGRVKAILAGAA